MARIFVISILLLNILYCESLSLLNGDFTFTENTRLANHLVQNRTNIGIGMCIRDCRALSGCLSVNYNKFTFLCELNAAQTEVGNDTDFYTEDGTYFVDLQLITPFTKSCFKYGAYASSLCPVHQILTVLHNTEEKCVTKDRIICSKGFFFNGKECESCPVGSFQALQDRSWCDLCPPGTFQDEIGQESCTSCETGTYQNSSGSDACKPCPSDGYYDYCNKNERGFSSSSDYNWWSYGTSCNRSTTEYYYSRYSYSIFRSAINNTHCNLFPTIRDRYFSYFSSIYSTIKTTSVYTAVTSISSVRHACVNKCVWNSEPCDAVMHNYKNSSYHTHSCSLLQLTEVKPE